MRIGTNRFVGDLLHYRITAAIEEISFSVTYFIIDYIVSKGHNTRELERRIWTLLEARGAQYPAEHNVGHL